MGYEKGYQHAKEDSAESKTRSDPIPPPPEDERTPEDEMTEDEQRKFDEDNRMEEQKWREMVEKGLVDPVDYSSKLYHPILVDREMKDGKISSITISVEDLRGVFAIDVKIASGLKLIDNGYLPPSALKIDIKITDYPYTQKDTQVALLMDMGMVSHTPGDLSFEKDDRSYDEEKGYTTDEEMFKIRSSDFQGFFSWVKYAMCDGKNQSVGVAQTHSFYGSNWAQQGQFTQNYKGVVFCYPRANKIIHDPKIGFITVQDINVYKLSEVSDAVESLLNGNIWIYLISGFIAVAFVVVSRRVRSKYY